MTMTDQPASIAEVVPAEQDALPATVERHNATIDHLTEGVLAMPGIPGRDEFINLCLQAKLLSMSAALPKGMRGNAHLCLHVVLLARDLGVSPASATNLIDFIPDNAQHPEQGGQLSLSPEFLCARVARLGLGKVELLVQQADRAVAVALEPGGRLVRDVEGNVTEIRGEIGRTEFDWQDGITAGLVDPRCKPHQHWVKPGGSARSYSDRCDCRTGYRTYPKRMMGWRAKGYCVTDWFPEASLGMYSPEELGAEVDENGRLIDPDTIALPSGYEPATRPPGPGEEPVGETERAWLRIEVACLDEPGRIALREQLRGRVPAFGSPDLTAGHVNMIRSLIRGVKATRARDGYDEPIETRRVHDWLMAQIAPPEAATTPETPPEAATAPTPPEPAPQAVATPETPQEPAEVPADPEAPGPADGEYRDGLDEVYVALGRDGLEQTIKTLTPGEVEIALTSRGGDDFLPAEQAREQLVGRIVRANPQTPGSEQRALDVASTEKPRNTRSR
jgi:hypothetical protein